jgi:hypothetical protein
MFESNNWQGASEKLFYCGPFHWISFVTGDEHLAFPLDFRA